MINRRLVVGVFALSLVGCTSYVTTNGKNWSGPKMSVAEAYPPLALKAEREAVVGLTCELSPDRWPVNCAVAFESAEGWGFGEAALKLAARMTVENPVFQPGGRVIFPIYFCGTPQGCDVVHATWQAYLVRRSAP